MCVAQLLRILQQVPAAPPQTALPPSTAPVAPLVETTTRGGSSSDGKGAEYDADSDMKDFILCSLSMILSIGLINRSIETSDGDEDYDEKLTNIMNAIQTIQEALGEYNCALGDTGHILNTEVI